MSSKSSISCPNPCQSANGHLAVVQSLPRPHSLKAWVATCRDRQLAPCTAWDALIMSLDNVTNCLSLNSCVFVTMILFPSVFL